MSIIFTEKEIRSAQYVRPIIAIVHITIVYYVEACIQKIKHEGWDLTKDANVKSW